MLQWFILTTILVLTGLIIGFNLQNQTPPPIIAIEGNSSNEALQKLIDENRILFARLTSIETQQIENKASLQAVKDAFDTLQNKIDNNQLTVHTPPPIILPDPKTLTPPQSFAQVTELISNNKAEALSALGIDESITQRIKAREEKQEMDHLYLRDAAIREGWFGTEKYFEKTKDIDQTSDVYREELGDEDYDRYLFKTGQSNRVKVLSVISNSPAANIGIEKSDIIVQYDQETIFSWSDLTQSTTHGDAGQEVSIIIQRNGAEIEFFIPRGPLGIRLENVKLNPD